MAISASWYLSRLRAMELEEIKHRVIEKAKKLSWRHNSRGWDNFSHVSDGQLAALPSVQQRLAQTSSILGDNALAVIVRRIKEGHFEFLGSRWSEKDSFWHMGVPNSDFWLLDPITGKLWPGADTYCFNINFRHAVKNVGDVKYVWELNRLQFLHPVAAQLAETADTDLASWAFGIIASWMNSNPPYRGINWVSGIELSLRLVSLALLVAAVGPSKMKRDERTMVRQFIAAHGYWLHRYPSLYSSANNHLIAEGLGLFIAGLLVPDLQHADIWRKIGRNILESETLKQISCDGVGVEQSPTYQAFSMEMIALAAVLADDIGESLTRRTLNRLALGAEHLDWILDSSGHAPAIGDNDEGRTIAQPFDREPRYIASITAAIAGLTKRDIAPPHDPHIRDALFSAPRQQRGPIEGLRTFPIGGYSTVHERIKGHIVDLVFDHGPLGYLSLAAHGHADALAIWLSLDGIPAFVDAGTYLYHSGREMRNQLRSTSVHNTLVIAEKSQSQITGPFMWGAKANAHLVSSRSGPNWSISGEHDGYADEFGKHHLRVVERNNDGITICDRLAGSDRTVVASIQFLCNPKLVVKSSPNGVIVYHEGNAIIELLPPAGFETDIMIADESGRGWYSAEFGTLIPAPMIVFRGNLTNQTVITRLRIRSVGEYQA